MLLHEQTDCFREKAGQCRGSGVLSVCLVRVTLRRLTSLSWLGTQQQDFDTDLVPKFKKQVEQLKNLIFVKVSLSTSSLHTSPPPLAVDVAFTSPQHATVKQVGGRDVTGRMFANLARAYAAATNAGAVPHIDDVWQGVVRAECKVRTMVHRSRNESLAAAMHVMKTCA